MPQPPTSVDPSAVPRPARDAAWKEVAGELVVLDVKQGTVRGLNPTGGRVWALMDGRRTVAEIAAAVAVATGESEARVLEDVRAFVSKLHALGMIDLAT